MAKKVTQSRCTDKGVLQLKIDLQEARPPIWRRVLAPPSFTLGDLHYLIQDAMGWTNSHMHEFVVGGEWTPNGVWDGTRYRDARFDDGDEDEGKDENGTTLKEVLQKPGDFLAYIYDFGDNWMHRVELEEILDKAPRNRHVPCCTGGERACPPDDCGGIWGYEELLAILANPKHEDYEDMKEWIEGMVGESFDPDAFNIAAANRAIQKNMTRTYTKHAMQGGWQ